MSLKGLTCRSTAHALPRSPAKGRILACGAAATREIDALLTSEFEAAGLCSDQLLLVGFSQGTMMSLHVGLRRPEAVAGFSGMLVAPVRLQAEVQSRPPVRLIHGTEDDVVAIRSMSLAETALAGAGVGVETRVSPGVAHSVGQDGLAAATAFAKRVAG